MIKRKKVIFDFLNDQIMKILLNVFLYSMFQFNEFQYLLIKHTVRPEQTM